jgi:hypothetical protein
MEATRSGEFIYFPILWNMKVLLAKSEHPQIISVQNTLLRLTLSRLSHSLEEATDKLLTSSYCRGWLLPLNLVEFDVLTAVDMRSSFQEYKALQSIELNRRFGKN